MEKLPLVKDCMNKDVITINQGATIVTVIETLLKNDISGAPVVNENNDMIGIITEKDCMRIYVDSSYHDIPSGKVTDFMSSTVMSIASDKTILDAAKSFIDNSYKGLPVVDGNKLVGQISRRDVLKMISDIKA